MNTDKLARGAVCLALCLVHLSLFRGFLNILNALVVPLALGLLTSGWSSRSRMGLAGTLLLATVVVVPLQAVFVPLYVVLAGLLQASWPRGPLARVVVLTPLVAAGFFGAIVLTDLVFGTLIARTTLQILGGSLVAYGGILLLESLLISGLLVWLFRLLVRRTGTGDGKGWESLDRSL